MLRNELDVVSRLKCLNESREGDQMNAAGVLNKILEICIVFLVQMSKYRLNRIPWLSGSIDIRHEHHTL